MQLKKGFMLDNTTKKRIDDCRDILVGKLPDPKSQIEQITIALIYKFMNDMDKESIDLGGAAKFFSGEFEEYSWDNLFDTKVTANKMLKLYSESIESMEKNPNIPQLFRDIFKNAYLPYRDPETLRLFLKAIGEFEYTHSERLGDAFEYLLSVMGSQGDAGQFRTPRHIIDFIVEAVDPDKTDTILDPACGTAGFLISAFKRIKDNYKSQLTPDDRRKLIKNFIGYDISPDMVRLSLVNLYLHGFSDPRIDEYDTLTSEKQWYENFDVILANPPFMSPKGGIRPHKKFTVKSNRSEVLFVDYITEHLNPNGRAGIIVPEGVIFQNGKAYKELRKMLVDDYLYAVVSLPAGVFNPYSGVKTSILLMDKVIAKKSNKILFVKIENDGFNLGAQRISVKGGQLEETIQELNKFKECNENNTEFENTEIAHAVEKLKIAENGEYNLGGESYKSANILSTEYDSVKLGKVCKVINGRAYKKKELLDTGKYPVLRVGNFFSNRGWYYSDLELNSDKYCLKGDLLYAWSASFGPKIWDGEKCIYHYHIWKMVPDEKVINKNFLYHILNKETEAIKAEGGRGIAMIHITKGGIEQRKIPLPPLPIQKKIVVEIEGYQKIIDGAKMVVENYKPQIDIDPDWEMVQLQEVCDVTSGGTPSRKKNSYWNGKIPYVKTGEIKFNKINSSEEFISEAGLKNSSTKLIAPGSILMAMYGQGVTRGRVAILEIEAAINQAVAAISNKSGQIINQFMFYQLQGLYEHLRRISDARGGNQSNLNAKLIKELKIVVPKKEIQIQIVAQIEKEQKLINANKQLVEIFEQKIKDRLAKVWRE